MTDRYIHHVVGESHGVLNLTTRIFFALPSVKDETPEERERTIELFEQGYGESELVGVSLVTKQPVLPTNEVHAAIAQRVLNGLGFDV